MQEVVHFHVFFCAASYNYRPYRIRKTEKILEVIEKFKKSCQKIGLIGSSVLSHPDFTKIGEYILKIGKYFSVSSMRIDTITDEKIELLLKARNNTFTVAIEAGNDRLRKFINKKLTDEQIFKAIEKFIKYKVLNLKFYFLIGLPGETEEDIFDIVNLVKRIKGEYLKHKKELKIFGKFIVSVNPFIPKRNTPFFNCKFEEIGIVKRKIKIIRESLKKEPNVEVKIEDPYTCFLQYILSVKDSKFLPLIIEKVERNYSNKKFYELVQSVDKG